MGAVLLGRSAVRSFFWSWRSADRATDRRGCSSLGRERAHSNGGSDRLQMGSAFPIRPVHTDRAYCDGDGAKFGGRGRKLRNRGTRRYHPAGFSGRWQAAKMGAFPTGQGRFCRVGRGGSPNAGTSRIHETEYRYGCGASAQLAPAMTRFGKQAVRNRCSSHVLPSQQPLGSVMTGWGRRNS